MEPEAEPSTTSIKEITMPQFRPYPIINQSRYQDRNVGEEFQQGINSALDNLIQMDRQKKAEELASNIRQREEALKLSGMYPYQRQQYFDALDQMQPQRNPTRKISAIREGAPQPLNVLRPRERIQDVPNPYQQGAQDIDLAQVYQTHGPKVASGLAGAQDRQFERKKDEQEMSYRGLQMEKLKQEMNKPKEAKKRMTGNLENLSNLYGKLYETGAAISTDQSFLKNSLNRLRSSGMGQQAEQFLGTEAQSYRNLISQIKPLALQDIRQATNMSARGLDSEKELEFYLKAVTSDEWDIRSNIQALQTLDKAYGLGLGIKAPDLGFGVEPGTVKSYEGVNYKYLLGDPNNKNNWVPIDSLNDGRPKPTPQNLRRGY